MSVVLDMDWAANRTPDEFSDLRHWAQGQGLDLDRTRRIEVTHPYRAVVTLTALDGDGYPYFGPDDLIAEEPPVEVALSALPPGLRREDILTGRLPSRT